jgi:hypothetical protein
LIYFYLTRPTKTKKQSGIINFGFTKTTKKLTNPKPNSIDTASSSGAAGAADARSDVSLSLQVTQTSAVDRAVNATVDLTSDSPAPTAALKQTHCCNGVIPLNKKTINEHLERLFKYACRNNPQTDYCLKMIGDTLMCNIFHDDCTGEGFPYTGSVNAGLRCPKCQALLKSKGTKLKTMAQAKGTLFKEVMLSILATELSADNASALDCFSRTKEADLNEDGLVLKSRAKALLMFYKSAKVSKVSTLKSYLTLY